MHYVGRRIALSLPLALAAPTSAFAQRAPTTPAQPKRIAGRDFPDPPSNMDVSVLGGNADTLILAGRVSVAVLMRSGRIVQAEGIAAPQGVVVDPSGRRGLVFGERGQFAHWDGSVVRRGQAPALEREEITAAVVPPQGPILLAGRNHAVYKWEGRRWHVLRYGTSGVDAVAVAQPNAKEIVVVSRSGRVLARGDADSTFRERALSAPLLGPLEHVSLRGTQGFMATTEHFVHTVDWATGVVERVRSPQFFSLSALTVSRAAGVDLAVLATMSDLALYDRKAFYKVSSAPTHPTALYLDVRTRTLFEIGMGPLRRHELRHPALGTGPATPWPGGP